MAQVKTSKDRDFLIFLISKRCWTQIKKYLDNKMLVRVVGEINATGRQDTQSYSLLTHTGETSYVSTDAIDLVRCYTNMEDGIDWDIGGSIFNELMFDAGFCKKPDDHQQAWSHETHGRDDNCDCDFIGGGPVFVVTTNKGINYVVHPEESHLFDRYVSSKRLKSE